MRAHRLRLLMCLASPISTNLSAAETFSPGSLSGSSSTSDATGSFRIISFNETVAVFSLLVDLTFSSRSNRSAISSSSSSGSSSSSSVVRQPWSSMSADPVLVVVLMVVEERGMCISVVEFQVSSNLSKSLS
ncbi:hypothetical protein EDD21DRAFT_381998 [Dissophora ornata]|nr:hypothetical protein EDD21DRAFT_381998 [Dissophora ornata]